MVNNMVQSRSNGIDWKSSALKVTFLWFASLYYHNTSTETVSFFRILPAEWSKSTTAVFGLRNVIQYLDIITMILLYGVSTFCSNIFLVTDRRRFDEHCFHIKYVEYLQGELRFQSFSQSGTSRRANQNDLCWKPTQNDLPPNDFVEGLHP